MNVQQLVDHNSKRVVNFDVNIPEEENPMMSPLHPAFGNESNAANNQMSQKAFVKSCLADKGWDSPEKGNLSMNDSINAGFDDNVHLKNDGKILDLADSEADTPKKNEGEEDGMQVVGI